MNNMIRNTVLFSSFAVLILSYQNCSQTGEFGSLLKQSNPENFSFPVKAETDYIGVMSCGGLGAGLARDPDFFTIRVMSDSIRNGGGIGLSENFIAEVENEREKRPAVFNMQQEISQSLAANPKIKNARLQLDVLPSSNLANRVIYDSNQGKFFSTIVSNYMDDPTLKYDLSMKTDSSTVKKSMYDYTIDLDLRAYSYELLGNWFSEMKQNGGKAVGVHFTPDPDMYSGGFDGTDRSYPQNAYARAPLEYGDNESTGAYGRHFALTFDGGQVTHVQEFESEQKAGSTYPIFNKSWSCRRLTIVKPTSNFRDAGKTPPVGNSVGRSCIANNNPRLEGTDNNPEDEEYKSVVGSLNANDNFERALIRVLGDNWYINGDKNCVVHRSAFLSSVENKYGCYGDGNQSILYGNYDTGSDSSSTLNPKYLTVCYATYN